MEKPILFNTEMVQAILEGRKTVTRRVVKSKSKNAAGFTITYDYNNNFTDVYDHDANEGMFDSPQSRYRVGDILYVRETWHEIKETHEFLYRADYFKKPSIDEVNMDKGMMNHGLKWKPSIHMPKAASRIFLEVTNIRVERLQDITEEQAIKEGCRGIRCEKPHNYNSDECCGYCNNSGYIEPPQLEFLYLWNSTLKKEQLGVYGWDANPWVWVIEFKVKEVKN